MTKTVQEARHLRIWQNNSSFEIKHINFFKKSQTITSIINKKIIKIGLNYYDFFKKANQVQLKSFIILKVKKKSHKDRVKQQQLR